MSSPTQEELNDLSLACNRLWSLDDNRLEPGREYVIDLQVGGPSDHGFAATPQNVEYGERISIHQLGSEGGTAGAHPRL